MPLISAGAAAAAAGLGALGGLANTGMQWGMNAQLQKDQQRFNAEQAALQRDWSSNENQLGRDWSSSENQINRDFQERMSSTAFQRQLADMKAAGINPAMALGNMGASAAGGSPMGNTSSSSGMAAQSGVNRVSGGDNIMGKIASSAISTMIKQDPDEFEKLLHQEINSSAKDAHKMINIDDIDASKLEDISMEDLVNNLN